MFVELFQFQCAVRGFHYYKRSWQPRVEEVLGCAHEPNNPYDYFAIKTYKQENEAIVGHLPMEISRPTKFLLQRGTLIEATLCSTLYRRSPLVQGGLEIPCKVTIRMPDTIKNRNLIGKYKEMIELLYIEPDSSSTLGSFLYADIGDEHSEETESKRAKPPSCARKVKRKKNSDDVKVKDIRSFFVKNMPPNKTKSSQECSTSKVVELDSDDD